jgi:hypothetical protein
MRAFVSGIATAALIGCAAAAPAVTKLSPNEIQATFFNGQPFTSSTTSNIQFKMVFMPGGKMTREPAGKSGIKGEGTWKLSKDGFCTTWKGSKENCYSLLASGNNKWSVVKGTAAMGTWSK